ncbi:unnamed protein product [Prorocentrum cordatum]|uniref:Tyrosine specific protein phosphatases domain-containing protein n=1 Tax=Prorocentrum cordatum TaxID=2364126 RepID=A0ABN9XD73_9DINO|nr:unnamed protein product [Polarella glacialis]
MSCIAGDGSTFAEALETASTWATGPHDKSNWLVPDCILVGGWPYRLPRGRGSPGETAEEGRSKLSSILTAGTRTFVTLTEPRELRGKPYAWGAFKSEAEAQFAALHGPRRQAMRLGRELRFLQCPMPDGGVTSDEQLARLLAAILQELSQDRALYVHCYGGHGRAGIVSEACSACSSACPPRTRWPRSTCCTASAWTAGWAARGSSPTARAAAAGRAGRRAGRAVPGAARPRPAGAARAAPAAGGRGAAPGGRRRGRGGRQRRRARGGHRGGRQR